MEVLECINGPILREGGKAKKKVTKTKLCLSGLLFGELFAMVGQPSIVSTLLKTCRKVSE